MKNIGVEKATEAARAIGARLAVPDEPGDLNDLFIEYDEDEVRQQLDAAIEVARIPAEVSEGALVPGDVAFADRFVEQHADAVRFCEQGGKVWDLTRWAPDNLGQIQELGMDTARSIFDDAKEAETQDERVKLGKWAVTAQSKSRIDAGIGLARSNPAIRVTMSAFDSDDMLLNCPNGTLDLRTGKLQRHQREDLITKVCGAPYDESAKCDRFEQFLNEIFAGNSKLISFMQRGIGYTLTGDTSEQSLNLCYGTGANGKSVLLEIIRELLGDYGAASSIESFTYRSGRGIPNDIARLNGVRFVAVGETQERAWINESLIKDVTGGDTITARFLHKEFFEFRPKFKLWIRANHKPRIKGTDHGIWRRINLIPFDVTIRRKDRDPRLLERLRRELPGILSWAVRGCIEWQRHGLQPPSIVKRATRSYRSEQDVLGTYLEERIDNKKDSFVIATPLYTDYTGWCDTNGERPLSMKEFSAAMVERGYEKDRKEKGMAYLGINLKS